MKVHDLLVTEVATAVKEIFINGSHADKVIEKSLKFHRKWGARDRRFFAESVYEIVRWWRYLWWLHGMDQSSTEVQDLKSIWALWWLWQKDEVLDLYLKVNPNEVRARLKQSPPRAIAFQKKKPAFTNLIRLIYYFNLEFISISANSLARLTHSVIN